MLSFGYYGLAPFLSVLIALIMHLKSSKIDPSQKFYGTHKIIIFLKDTNTVLCTAERE